MEEKAVLITGCSSGIGLCLAQGLQRRGYRVFASARKAEDVDRLNAQGLESLRLDLSDSGSIKQGLNEVLARSGGRLYALINNGAYGQPAAAAAAAAALPEPGTLAVLLAGGLALLSRRRRQRGA